ncbi:MAG: hypothetical protein H0V97_12355, partial [Actinobacteria bacterium]|nr:hypothetical protein [Actinomycetota bacterium]
MSALADSPSGMPLRLSEQAASALLRALGAYLRSTPRRELPGALRRFHGLRQAALGSHAPQILSALDLEDVRARVSEYLQEGRPRRARSEAELLRVAVERPEGWMEKLESHGATPTATAIAEPPPRARESGQLVERERKKVEAARAGERRARERGRAVETASTRTIAALQDEVGALKAQVGTALEAEAEAQQRAAKLVDDKQRVERKRRRDLEEARSSEKDLRAKLKGVKRELAASRAQTKELERRLRAFERPNPGAPVRPAEPGGPRRPLAVPHGLFEDDPSTLEGWLGMTGVMLIVDGYNVSKHEGGFKALELEGQRERVIDEVGRLASRKKIVAIVV